MTLYFDSTLKILKPEFSQKRHDLNPVVARPVETCCSQLPLAGLSLHIFAAFSQTFAQAVEITLLIVMFVFPLRFYVKNCRFKIVELEPT